MEEVVRQFAGETDISRLSYTQLLKMLGQYLITVLSSETGFMNGFTGTLRRIYNLLRYSG
jgi:hypothetical protein